MEWVVGTQIPSVLKKIKNSGRQFIQHGDNVITLATAMATPDFNALATLFVPNEGIAGSNGGITTRGPMHNAEDVIISVRNGVGGTTSTFTELTAATMPAGNNQLLQAASISIGGAGNNITYWGTQTSPSNIVPYSYISGTLTQGTILTLNTGENNVKSSAFAGGFMYVGTTTSPARIVKISIGTTTPTRVSSITLNSGENNAIAMAIDSINNMLYVSCNTNPVIIVKIDLGTFTRVSSITFPGDDLTGETGASSDSFRGFAYFNAKGTFFGKVIRVNYNNFTQAATSIYTTSGTGILLSSVIDTANQFLYVGDNGAPATVYKVDLTTFTENNSRVVTPSVLNTAQIDVANAFAYFMGNNSPCIISKINLSTFTESATLPLTLTPNENDGESSLIDTTNGFLFVGTNTSPGKVIQVNIANVSVAGTTNRLYIKCAGGFGFTAGGFTTTQVTTSERFDDVNNTWTGIAALGTARSNLAAAGNNFYAIITEGITAANANAGITERWEFVVNLMVARTSDTTGRYDVSAFTINGYTFIADGLTFAGGSQTMTNRFDDGTNAWSTRLTVALPFKYYYGAFGLNNLGFYVGGIDNNGVPSAAIYRFDDTSPAWTARTSMGTAKARTVAWSMRGFGFNSTGELTGFAAVTGITERFDDVANSWAGRQANGTARNSASAFQLNGFGFVCDGSTDPTAGEPNNANIANVDRFDDVSDVWTSRTGGTARARLAGCHNAEVWVNYQVSEP